MGPFRFEDGRHSRSDRSDGATAVFPGGVSRVEAALWAVVVGVMVLDIALTVYGLSAGFVEANPVIRRVLEVLGIGGLFLAKGIALSIALAVRARFPRFALVPPLGLALPWAAAVGINLAVLTAG